jgi:DNA polymerase-3 subunit gamma/tau
MSQALYRKYRPKSWEEVVGQDHVVLTLRNAVTANRLGHAYLFAGPRGTGKTTLARILAKAINCLTQNRSDRPCNACENCRALNENRFLDLIEMDAASNTGVEDVRELRDKIGFAPSQGAFKVYIIDEVHMLSTSAFNALLKTLEEPPPHVVFILATTEIHKIPATVLSRCQRHEFRRVSVDQITANLQQIVAAEGLQADPDALSMIARQATGSIRDAQSLLDQLSSVGTAITVELTQATLGTATSRAVLDLVDAIHGGNPESALSILRSAIDSGTDPRTLARQVVDYLRGAMLLQMGNSAGADAGLETRDRMRHLADVLPAPQILRMLRAFNVAASDTRGGWQPSLPLELAVAELLAQASESPDSSSDEGASGPAGGPGIAPKAVPKSGRPPGLVGNNRRPTRDAVGRPPTLYQEATSPAVGEREAATDSEGTTSVQLSQVVSQWKEIRAALKPKHPAVEALLNSCKPMEVQGGTLVLGFQSETVKALMDKEENLHAAVEAIRQVLGSPLRLRCAVTNTKGKVPPRISHDGMVATALDRGGEIVDVQD